MCRIGKKKRERSRKGGLKEGRRKKIWKEILMKELKTRKKIGRKLKNRIK